MKKQAGLAADIKGLFFLILTPSSIAKNQADGPAKWSQDLDDEFVAYYVETAGRAHDVASGGKCFKNAAWQGILAKMDGRGNITDIKQLKNRWKRLKEDYVDYAWLVKKFSGDILEGIDDEKWAELD
ncbi:hypothetical protein AC1031_020511 [Aphanomyces cochlioides]|nr:hypothetical protein AC1031_020511 [Aphanomyces cochlioides]